MASAKTGVHIMTLQELSVDERLSAGETFLKWTDLVSSVLLNNLSWKKKKNCRYRSRAMGVVVGPNNNPLLYTQYRDCPHQGRSSSSSLFTSPGLVQCGLRHSQRGSQGLLSLLAGGEQGRQLHSSTCCNNSINHQAFPPTSSEAC